MVVGDDIAVLAVDDAAARALRNILTQPGVCGDGLGFNRDDGIFVFCDDFLNRELTACRLGQIVVRCVYGFVYGGAAKIADCQRVSAGADRGGDYHADHQHQRKKLFRNIRCGVLFFFYSLRRFGSVCINILPRRCFFPVKRLCMGSFCFKFIPIIHHESLAFCFSF